MKRRLEEVAQRAAAAGLSLAQIRICYDKNPTPFLLTRTIERDGEVFDSEIVYVNEAFEDFSGMSSSHVIGRGFDEINPDVNAEYLHLLSRVGETGISKTMYDFRDTMGRYVQVDCFQIAMNYCGCMLYDVSDSHFLRFLDSDALSLLQESVDGGIVVLALRAPNQLMYMNQSICSTLGYLSFQELREAQCNQVPVYPEDLVKIKKRLRELPCNESYQCTCRMLRKDGGIVWLSVRGKRAMMQGTPVLVSVTHDITNEMNQMLQKNRIALQSTKNIGSQYYATYTVDMKNGRYVALSQDAMVKQSRILPSGDYRSTMLSFVETFVHPEDQAAMRSMMEISNFRKNAQLHNGFRMMTREFRRSFHGGYQWAEVLMSMNIAQTDEDELLTVAFRNIHAEKMQEFEKKYLDVFSYAVMHSYESVLEYDATKKILYSLTLGEHGLFREPCYTTDSAERISFVKEYIHPDDALHFLEEISPETVEQMEAGTNSVQFEYRRRLRGTEKEYHWCSYTLRAFSQNGRTMYILFVKDIHDEKVRHLQQQRKLQSAVVAAERRVMEKTDQLFTYYGKTIELMSSVVEYRSLESGVHVRRIKNYTEELLRAAAYLFPEEELTEEKIHSITEASALHDVGKIGVPDNILLKPARLTCEEFEIMKTHTVIGADIAREIPCVDERGDEFEYGYKIARYHHERYDGKGYPDGLSGEQIPFCAQVVSIADVFDALTTKRVYKDAYSDDRAYEMIMTGECGVFSPRLLDCFLRVRPKFIQLSREQ